MKKVLVLVVAATIFGHFAFAEKVMEAGVKGGLLLNAGTKYDSSYLDGNAVTKMSVGGNVGIFGHFGLVDLGSGTLSLQPEIFFSFANGLNEKYLGTIGKIKYTSLDIALLIGYDIPVGKLCIRPFLGPKLGFPFGKFKVEVEDFEVESDLKAVGPTIGMDFGCGIAIPLGKFVLGADVRYGIDFNKVKAEEYGIKIDCLRRGALGINITAGYRF